jgi:hypothetical protein
MDAQRRGARLFFRTHDDAYRAVRYLIGNGRSNFDLGIMKGTGSSPVMSDVHRITIPPCRHVGPTVGRIRFCAKDFQRGHHIVNLRQTAVDAA